MAQQITIDIVAETKKLTAGINEANDQLGGMSKSLKTAGAAAAGLASAFVLKEGISFLKDGIEEAQDARKAMLAATSAFGKGSKALQEITKDAEAFGKELAIDNDDIIKLATGLGVKLPKEARDASAELVVLAKNLEASSSGAISAESTLSKLGKAFVDGEINAKELAKVIPGLDDATIKMVETLSKAGKNQEALNVLIEAGEKKYGGAAASQVTATQKFDVALANLKETIGTKVLPVLEKLIDFATKMIDAFSAQPKILQNVELALLAIVAVGGPLLGFLASAKTAMVTLGLVSEGAALGTNVLSTAMKALPWVALIAAIVLAIQHWDKIKDAVQFVWEKIQAFGNWVKPFLDAVWTSIKNIFELALGLIKTAVTTYFDGYIKVITFFAEFIVKAISESWNITKDVIEKTMGAIKDILEKVWLAIATQIVDITVGIRDKINAAWTSVKDKTIQLFNNVKDYASDIWDGIKSIVGGAITAIGNAVKNVFGDMVNVGKDIARGIMEGLTSSQTWFKFNFKKWIDDSIIGWARVVMKIQSPSKVMMGIGEQITEGLYVGMGLPGAPGINLPRINVNAAASSGIVVNINAGLGTDPYSLGRAVDSALSKYGTISKTSMGATI